jgi:hybrid polyketide synthase/nonribosomal peptide synthetase ACE1
MHTIGKHMPAVIRGETTILEHLTKDNLLNDYYGEALGISYYTEYLARIVGQLDTHICRSWKLVQELVVLRRES